MDTAKKVKDAGLILGGLGVIGFIGIVWLMIYGNLSGNLGFTQDSTAFINETITLDTPGNIPSTAQSRTNPTLSNVQVYNESDGVFIASGNYTVTGVTFTNTTFQFGGVNVNVSATVIYDSAGLINTEGVITDITGGFGTFFGFSNTFFKPEYFFVIFFFPFLEIINRVKNSTN